MLRLTAAERCARRRVTSAAASALAAAPSYARHVPERTLLYALVQAYYPDFIARLAAEDRSLPEYVRAEFEAFLRCGVLEHGFLRVVCAQCPAELLLALSCKKRGFCPSCGARRMAESARHLVGEVFGPRPVRQWVLSFPYPLRFLFASKPEAIGPVLAIAHRVIAGWLADQAGIERASAQCGAVTLIQRFGSALNLNIHFHMLWLDGVYEENVGQPQRKPRLHRTRAPTSAQLTELAGTIAHRVCRHLTRQDWLEGEDDSTFLSDCAGRDDGLDTLRMSSITYRIATGRHAGRKVATLQTLPGGAGPLEGGAGNVGGFSLHAGVAAEAHEPLHRVPGDLGEAAVDRAAGQGALPAQDAVAEWHHPCRVRAHRVHRETGRAGAATARAPDKVPRRVCAERPLACAADAIGAWQTACHRCSAGSSWKSSNA